MMLLPLVAVRPLACSARAFRALCRALRRSLRYWSARDRDRFYFGALNEYEIERLAKDIGLSRGELLGEQYRPSDRSPGPPLPAKRRSLETAREPRLSYPTDV
jgi:uncharacterized protein YjiS (DUF1127 family)